MASAPASGHVAWESYAGTDALLLAILLAATAAVLAWLAARLQSPIRVQRPGLTISGFMIALWALSILLVLVAETAYLIQIREAFPALAAKAAGHAPRAARVNVGTFPDAAVAFLLILYLTRRFGWAAALASAFVGAAAAPMLFEAPFDLIVIWRTNPVIPPNPALYRALFFLPLFLAELSTVSLLALLPSFRITRGSLFALAAMFAVFAIWAAFGFAYPNRPLPLALNIVSKMLCFAAAVLCFVWRDEAPTESAQGVSTATDPTVA